MIALIAYQFQLFRRGRFWLVPVVGGLAYLVVFYVRVSDPHPGAYGRGAEAMLLYALGLAWTLCLTQEPALWQLTIVSAGSRERAQLSRILLSWLIFLPMAVIAALVTASHRLGEQRPLPALIAGILLYLLLGLLGCAVGVAAGSRTGPKLVLPVCLFVAACWLAIVT